MACSCLSLSPSSSHLPWYISSNVIKQRCMALTAASAHSSVSLKRHHLTNMTPGWEDAFSPSHLISHRLCCCGANGKIMDVVSLLLAGFVLAALMLIRSSQWLLSNQSRYGPGLSLIYNLQKHRLVYSNIMHYTSWLALQECCPIWKGFCMLCSLSERSLAGGPPRNNMKTLILS